MFMFFESRLFYNSLLKIITLVNTYFTANCLKSSLVNCGPVLSTVLDILCQAKIHLHNHLFNCSII